MKKTYFLDTNIVLDDPLSIYNFKDNDVVMSITSIEEVDNNKTRQDNAGYNCRQFIREVNVLREIGSIKDGVSLAPAAAGTFKIVQLEEKDSFFKTFPKEINNLDKNDNLIIATAFSLNKKVDNLIVVTNDLAMACKCDAIGLKVQEYKKNKVVDSSDQIYKGYSTFDVTDQEIANLYDNSYLDVSEKFIKNGKLYPNQFLILNCEDGKTELARYNAEYNKIIPSKTFSKSVFGIRPKNIEQRMALDLLMDDSIDLVTLSGLAGSGKTILSAAAALNLVMQDKRYEKLILIKPTFSVSKDIGFLPGGILDKLLPLSGNFLDALNVLLKEKNHKKNQNQPKSNNSTPSTGSTYIDLLMENGIIEIASLSFLRGRSIANSFIIVDEIQNLMKKDILTIVSRCSMNTKIVLCGDPQQIDAPNVTSVTNGLVHAIEAFKNEKITGHVTLAKGERSAIANLAAKLL